jgi:hypothetical protein
VGKGDRQPGSLGVLRFPLPILIPQNALHLTFRGWYNRRTSGRRAKWTQSDPRPRISFSRGTKVHGVRYLVRYPLNYKSTYVYFGLDLNNLICFLPNIL